MAGPNDKPPHCAECRSGDRLHPYRRNTERDIFDRLCGSCAYKREHPDAAPMPPKPVRPKVPQKETLLDAIAELEAEPVLAQPSSQIRDGLPDWLGGEE